MKFSINKDIKLSATYDSKSELLKVELDVSSSKVFDHELKSVIHHFEM